MRRSALAVSVWLAGTLPFLTRLAVGRTSRDVEHYFESARAALSGAGLYTSQPFEYPAYAVLWFLGPAAGAQDAREFRTALGLVLWAFDAIIKGLLIWRGMRAARGFAAFRPFLVYTLGTAALGHILLQRFDLIPSALTFASLLALASGRSAASGALISIAACTKLYPALCVPAMATFAWRQSGRSLRGFLVGAILASVPLVALSFVWPWWNFVAFQNARGLEVGSLWASLIWLGHFLGVPASWGIVTGWVEVTGPVAASVVTPARVVWMGATLAAVFIGAIAVRAPDSTRLIVGALFPIAVFVTLSPVLSPQFQLWLLPLAALLLEAGPETVQGSGDLARRAAWCIFVGTLLVPAFFPSPTFDTGLDLGRTLVLVLRNGLLLAASWLLFRAVSRLRAAA